MRLRGRNVVLPNSADACLNDFKITSKKTLVIDQKITFIFAMSMTRRTRHPINGSNDESVTCRPSEGGNTVPGARGDTATVAGFTYRIHTTHGPYALGRLLPFKRHITLRDMFSLSLF